VEVGLWIFATFVAYFVKGMSGFASTLVFTNIMGFGVNNINISPVDLVIGYPSNVILTWKNRKELRASIYLPLILLVLIGSVPGMLLLQNVNATYVKIFFGVVVILVGLQMLLQEGKEAKQSKVLLVLIGIVSGVLCGMFGVGALLAAYVSRTTKSSNAFKANICAVFLVENTFRFVMYLILDIMTMEAIKQAMLMMPVMLLGLFLGMKSALFLDEKKAKRVVIILLLLSGIALILKNL